MSVDSIIAGVVSRESAQYTNDSNDAGGPTKFGITLRTLSGVKHWQMTAADVQALTQKEATEIYRHIFVEEPGFDRLLSLGPLTKPIAEKLIDAGVLSSPRRATEWLQRSLNAFNRQAKDYADVDVDGDCGPATQRALVSFLSKRGEQGRAVLLEAISSLQGAYLVELAERRPIDEEFTFGWFANRVAFKPGDNS